MSYPLSSDDDPGTLLSLCCKGYERRLASEPLCTSLPGESLVFPGPVTLSRAAPSSPRSHTHDLSPQERAAGGLSKLRPYVTKSSHAHHSAGHGESLPGTGRATFTRCVAENWHVNGTLDIASMTISRAPAHSHTPQSCAVKRYAGGERMRST